MFGKLQAQEYGKEALIPFERNAIHRHRLHNHGDRKFEGMRFLEIIIPVSDDFFLIFDVQVVNFDVHFLIAIGFLDTSEVSIDLANERML